LIKDGSFALPERKTLLKRYVFSLRVFIKASMQEFAYVAVFVAQKMA